MEVQGMRVRGVAWETRPVWRFEVWRGTSRYQWFQNFLKYIPSLMVSILRIRSESRGMQYSRCCHSDLAHHILACAWFPWNPLSIVYCMYCRSTGLNFTTWRASAGTHRYSHPFTYSVNTYWTDKSGDWWLASALWIDGFVCELKLVAWCLSIKAGCRVLCEIISGIHD